MKVLVVKTSSMGDILHTLPALTDAARCIPSISFDWVVEAPFAEIPAWHPRVDRVISTNIRAWRKNLFTKSTWQSIRDFYRALKSRQYEAVIDAQGLLKSALISRLSSGPRFGLDRHSAREGLSAQLYQHKLSIDKTQHAITRVRKLFAKSLGYAVPNTMADYGVDKTTLFDQCLSSTAYLVFLHGTTWESKHWPESHWRSLAKIALQHGLEVKLPWGNSQERIRAERIAEFLPGVEVLPPLDLVGVAKILAGAAGCVAVDTGLAHMSAALGVLSVSLYGPTNPAFSGAMGVSQKHLFASFPSCVPCFGRVCLFDGEVPQVNGESLTPPCLAGLTPEMVWERLAIT